VCLGLFNFREPEKVQVRGPGQLDKKCFVIFIRGTRRVTERRNSRLDRRDFVEFLKDPTWIHVGGPLSLAPLVLLTPVITRRHTRTLYRPSFSRTFVSILFLYVLYCCLNGARFVHPRKGRSYIHEDEDLSDSILLYLFTHSFIFIKLFNTKLFFEFER